jgi:hypothetical protein
MRGWIAILEYKLIEHFLIVGFDNSTYLCLGLVNRIKGDEPSVDWRLRFNDAEEKANIGGVISDFTCKTKRLYV